MNECRTQQLLECHIFLYRTGRIEQQKRMAKPDYWLTPQNRSPALGTNYLRGVLR